MDSYVKWTNFFFSFFQNTFSCIIIIISGQFFFLIVFNSSVILICSNMAIFWTKLRLSVQHLNQFYLFVYLFAYLFTFLVQARKFDLSFFISSFTDFELKIDWGWLNDELNELTV